MNSLRAILSLAVAVSLSAGCARKDGAARIPPTDTTPAHVHRAPHGGTAIVLGEEIYHLELVLDQAAGTLSAYVLDGEIENFVRSTMPSFEVVATLAGEKHPLTFHAIANAATGETIGDTAFFVAHADWLKTAHEFDGVIKHLVVRASTFDDVVFHFPKGNEAP